MRKLIFSIFTFAVFASIIFLAEIPRAPNNAFVAAARKSESSKAPTIDRAYLPSAAAQESKQWIPPAVGMMLLNSKRLQFEPIKELAGFAKAPRPRPRNSI